ncbi:MAG: arginine repressor, partial [Oscillospiraceae bacterium]|nr:arginine repressor [Oscillospiraceae bacterium]
MKKDRQKAILEVIAGVNVETQSQLIEELAKIGIESTQATVSRDIKALHLVKEPMPSGCHRYTVSGVSGTKNHTARLRAIFKESVTSYTFAQNIVVIKTLPGLAPAACGATDAMGIK